MNDGWTAEPVIDEDRMQSLPERASSGTTDAERMVALRRGDLGAYEQLIEKYKDVVYSYLARLVGDRAWAEDLCQETFLRVYRNRDEYTERHQFKAWLYRIARNLALDFLRRERRRPTVALPPGPVHVGPGPAEETRARELEGAIERAIGQLPVKFRNVLVLCALEGMSYEEAAEIEGCPAKTISSRLSRARRRFADSLEAYL